VQAKPKTSRRREIIKIRAKINEIETNKQTKTYKESMKQQADSLKKINKIDRSWQTRLKLEEKKPKTVKSESKGGDNNKHHGDPGNHQRLL
jgi:hypothetical protein